MAFLLQQIANLQSDFGLLYAPYIQLLHLSMLALVPANLTGNLEEF